MRPLRQGELDHELIWLSVSVAALVFLLACLQLHIPLPSCPFHDLTGFPCLTCGATRCFTQLSHGNFFAALRWNPGVFALLISLTLYNIYAMAVLALRLPRLRILPLSAGMAKKVRAMVWVLIGLNWIYLFICL